MRKTVLGLATVLAMAVGCQETSNSAKREQDRLALQVASAERDRDEARSALNKAQNEAEITRQSAIGVEAELAQVKAQNAELGTTVEQLKKEVAEAKADHATATVAAEHARQEAENARAQVANLEQELARQKGAAETAPAAPVAPATTAPVNDNK